MCVNLSNDSLGPAVRLERYFPWALWNVEENSKVYAEGKVGREREKKKKHTLDFIFLLEFRNYRKKIKQFYILAFEEVAEMLRLPSLQLHHNNGSAVH